MKRLIANVTSKTPRLDCDIHVWVIVSGVGWVVKLKSGGSAHGIRFLVCEVCAGRGGFEDEMTRNGFVKKQVG